MSEKVVLSKNEAKVFERVRADYNFETAMKVHVSDGGWSKAYGNSALNNLSAIEFAKAWIEEYEIQKTPQEIVQVEYDEALKSDIVNETGTPYFKAYAKGIAFAAKQFGYDVVDNRDKKIPQKS